MPWRQRSWMGFGMALALAEPYANSLTSLLTLCAGWSSWCLTRSVKHWRQHGVDLLVVDTSFRPLWMLLYRLLHVAVQIVATCHWQSVNVNQLLQNSRYLWLNMWFIFSFHLLFMPSVLWCCWLGGRKGIRPVKNEWWGAGVVICLEWGADLHMAQLMPLPPTVSCSSKIQIGFTFVVPAHLGSPGQRAVKRMLLFPFIVIS